MKRCSGVYASVYEFSNLEDAYRKASRCKRYRNEVLRFSAQKEERLLDIQNDLIWKTYKQGEYRAFVVTEPKRREIFALPFRDRVMHHAVNNVLEPLLDKRFYEHSYACRKDKGVHKASETLMKWIRDLSRDGKKVYVLKCDIRSYFRSIDHDVLKRALRGVIKDEDLLWLLDTIIDTSAPDEGIPIGNLSSQLFANMYLHQLDMFVKHDLREHYYIRYMDDFMILSHDIDGLRSASAAIKDFVEDKLKLTMNPKTAIVCAKNGVDFCGYRHWAYHRKIRKGSVVRMKNVLKRYKSWKIDDNRLERSMVSWLGHIRHADSYFIEKRMLEKASELTGKDVQTWKTKCCPNRN